MIKDPAIEQGTDEEIKKLQASKLRRMIRESAFIPQYSEMYKNAGITGKECDAELFRKFSTLPFTSRSDYCTIDKTALEHIDKELFFIESTSGSTGNPKTKYTNAQDDLNDVELIHRAFGSYGIAKTDRVVVYDIGELSFFSQFAKGTEPINRDTFFVNMSTNITKSVENIFSLKPDVLVTVPSLLMRSQKDLLTQLAKGTRLRKIIYFAESLNQNFREHLASEYGVECFSLYGSTEVGWIGAECESHDGIHLFTDSLLVDILNPKSSSKKFKNGSIDDVTGEIAFTALAQTGKPALKYLNGDIVTYTTAPCSCSRTTPRVLFEKRGVEDVSLFGMKISYDELHNIVYAGRPVVNHMQVVVQNLSDMTHMKFIVPQENFADHPEHEEEVISSLQKEPGMQFYFDHHILSFSIEYVDHNYFKDRKIKKIVDER